MSLDNSIRSEFDWDISTSGVTIKKYKGKDRNVVVPNEIDGKPVTSIEERTFYGCSSLENITLPDGLTSIGKNAFYGCIGLKNITLPDGLTSIGHSAFEGCIGLTSIRLPDRLTDIEYRTFAGCSGLTSITIPEGLTNIRENAFEGCSLKDVWYTGSRDQWEKIITDHGRRLHVPDKIFGDAAIHFGS